jgi:hypothetical protein
VDVRVCASRVTYQLNQHATVAFDLAETVGQPFCPPAGESDVAYGLSGNTLNLNMVGRGAGINFHR